MNKIFKQIVLEIATLKSKNLWIKDLLGPDFLLFYMHVVRVRNFKMYVRIPVMNNYTQYCVTVTPQ